jgi:hypothetical protein
MTSTGVGSDRIVVTGLCLIGSEGLDSGSSIGFIRTGSGRSQRWLDLPLSGPEQWRFGTTAALSHWRDTKSSDLEPGPRKLWNAETESGENPGSQ